MATTKIYHEKQTRQLCALHALNNLFQAKQVFTKEYLDSICTNLSPNVLINPHRSILGLGNYDINVLMTALQSHDCEMNWFDKRKDPLCIELSSVVGFILNVPSDYKFGFVTLPIRRRHWIAVRSINDVFYNLDSKLPSPERIGQTEELLAYLRGQLETNERELFVIVTTANSKIWLKDDPISATTVDD